MESAERSDQRWQRLQIPSLHQIGSGNAEEGDKGTHIPYLVPVYYKLVIVLIILLTLSSRDRDIRITRYRCQALGGLVLR